MLIDPAMNIEIENVFVNRDSYIKNFKEDSHNLEFRGYIVLFFLQKQDYLFIRKNEILNKIINFLDNSVKFLLVWEFLNSVFDNLKKWYYLYPLDPS